MIPQLIEEILSEHAAQLGGHPCRFRSRTSVAPPSGDRELLGTAIMQFIDNAAKYSTPGSPIAIAVDDREGEILISVHNEGSEVRQEDRERIFERFYRSPGSNHRAPEPDWACPLPRRRRKRIRARLGAKREGKRNHVLSVSSAHRAEVPMNAVKHRKVS